MGIHIGQIIKKTLKAQSISVAEFAEKINYSRGNAYKIFEKDTVDTGLLVRISEVLGENLFFNYIKESEIDEKFNEKLKVKLTMKVWDEFMQSVKAKEPKKKVKPTVKTTKKPVKKTKK